MRRVLLLVLLLLAAGVAHGQTCAITPSQPIGIDSSCRERCPLATPVTFMVFPLLPSGPSADGADLRACHQVIWDFGDGTVVTGGKSIAHTWTVPGNYTITAKIPNTLGTATATGRRIVGPEVIISLPAVTASEDAGQVSISVTRSGDTTGRVSATLKTYASGSSTAIRDGVYPVVFEPGQTLVTVVVPLFDNEIFDGSRFESIGLTEAAGGATLQQGSLRVTDDEPQPELVGDTLVIHEANGPIRAVVNVRLTAPIAGDLRIFGELHEGTAKIFSDFTLDRWGSEIKAGQTTGTFEFQLLGDREPERDEHLTLTLGPYFGAPWFPKTIRPVHIKILDDDAMLNPRVHSGTVGEKVTMTLSPSLERNTPLTVPVRSTNPAVVSVPETITIPPGALKVEFQVTLAGEGEALVELTAGNLDFSSRFTVRQPRALVSSSTSIALPTGGARTFTLALSPADDAPVTVTLTADPSIVAIPPSVTIPAGGTATVEVRGVGRGEATIAATAPDVAGTAIDVEVKTMRRRSVR